MYHGTNQGEIVLEVEVLVENFQRFSSLDALERAMNEFESQSEFVESLRNQGFDGVFIYSLRGEDEFCVFEASSARVLGSLAL